MPDELRAYGCIVFVHLRLGQSSQERCTLLNEALSLLSKGRIVQGGIVTVEAEGEFAVFNSREGVERMAASRRRSFDAAAGAVGGGE